MNEEKLYADCPVNDMRLQELCGCDFTPSHSTCTRIQFGCLVICDTDVEFLAENCLATSSVTTSKRFTFRKTGRTLYL